MRRSNLRNWINKNILVVQQAQNQSDLMLEVTLKFLSKNSKLLKYGE